MIQIKLGAIEEKFSCENDFFSKSQDLFPSVKYIITM